MTLVRMTPSMDLFVKTAQEDPENALALAEWVQAEIVSADLSRRDMEAEVAKALRSRNDRARVHLVSTFVKRRSAGEPVDDVLRAAGYLVGLDYWVEHAFGEPVRKAGRKEWDPKLHPRDQGGRFVRGVGRDDPGPQITRDMNDSNKPEVRKPGAFGPQTRAQSPDAKRKYISQYNQISDQIEGWKAQGLLDDFDAYVSMGTDAEPRRKEKKLTVDPSRTADDEGDLLGFYDPENPLVSEVYLRPKADKAGTQPVRAGMAAVDLTGGRLGGEEQTYRIGRGMVGAPDKLEGPGTEWANAGKTGKPRQALYNRLQAGGKLAELAAPISPGIAGMGVLAQTAGALGPHAEKIMGPTMQRAAYRYRGIETNPSRDTVEGVEQFNDEQLLTLLRGEAVTLDQVGADGKRITITPEQFVQMNNAALKQPGRRGAEGVVNPEANDVARVLDHYIASSDVDGTPIRSMANDRLRTVIQGDAATAAMIPHIPGNKESYLANKAGYPLPSHGVAIDSDGKVAYEATGYEHDHYLPFNLKHLKALNGGQYVRTRSTGGPTSEDIYAGLMSNARQFTVASRSGVFTVEFSPTFRGARRYNDKAVRMTRRYEKLLDTIGTGNIEERSLRQANPEAYQEIVRRAFSLHGNAKDPKAIEDYIADESAKLSRRAQFEGGDLEEQAYESVAHEYAMLKKPARGAKFEQMVAERQADLAERFGGKTKPTGQNLKLDAAGYARALNTLQQSFPEYIRSVRVQTLPDWLADRNFAPHEKLGAGTWAQSKVSDTNQVAAGALHTSGARNKWEAGPRKAEERTEGGSTGGTGGAGGTGGSRGATGSTGTTPQTTAAAAVPPRVAAGASEAVAAAEPLFKATGLGSVQEWGNALGTQLGTYDATMLMGGPGGAIQNGPTEWDRTDGGANALQWLNDQRLGNIAGITATKGLALAANARVMQSAVEAKAAHGGQLSTLPDPSAALDALDRAHGLTAPGTEANAPNTPLVPADWHTPEVAAAAEEALTNGEDGAVMALSDAHGDAAHGIVALADKYSKLPYSKVFNGGSPGRTEVVSDAKALDPATVGSSVSSYEQAYKDAKRDGLLRSDETNFDDEGGPGNMIATAKEEARRGNMAGFDLLKERLSPEELVKRRRAAVALGRQLFVGGGAVPKAGTPGPISARASHLRVLSPDHPLAVALHDGLVAALGR